jgi:hypothetical protein
MIKENRAFGVALVFDLKLYISLWLLKIFCRIMKSYFAMQMFLRRTRAPHIIHPSLQQFCNSAVSSTSSFGGLNPNRSFGFFFARPYGAQGLIPDARGREMAAIAVPDRLLVLRNSRTF